VSFDRLRRLRSTERQGLPSSPRRVALGATLVALLVYVTIGVVADVVVLRHFQQAADTRLAARLALFSETVEHDEAASRPIVAAENVPALDDDGDLDDAPIFGWWLPASSRSTTPLETGAPTLPAGFDHRLGPVDVTLAGRPFRLESTTVPGGRIAAATSLAQIASLRAIFLVAEAALLPVVLLTFFVAAYVIGRRAVMPVELARRRQLDFTADASHELRTPLSVIEAEVELALSVGRNAADYAGVLGRVAKESHRLRTIVEDLLWLARLDALPAPSRSEPVDLAVIAERCAARFTAVARQRGIALSTNTEPRQAVVDAPAEWLDRLASVLLDNACRYSEADGRVSVAVAVVDRRPTLTVDDSGPGIPEEERERIFQRFHRATFSAGGSGLGLSIADAIVRATGGRWDVGASPVGGARMRISWSPRNVDE
jgi:signal transduction histidine kinase